MKKPINNSILQEAYQYCQVESDFNFCKQDPWRYKELKSSESDLELFKEIFEDELKICASKLFNHGYEELVIRTPKFRKYAVYVEYNSCIPVAKWDDIREIESLITLPNLKTFKALYGRFKLVIKKARKIKLKWSPL